ncbi:zinc ABC transporter substrate-binding protein [Roseivivax sp. CAU 1761]
MTDIAPVHSLAARVMQGVGTPEMVLPSDASAHHHALRPSEARALQQADAVFWVGPDLTPWLAEAIDTLSPEAARRALLSAETTLRLDYREDAVFRIEAASQPETGAGGDAEDHGDGQDEGTPAEAQDDGHNHAEDAENHAAHGEHEDADHGQDDHGHEEHGHEEHGHEDHGHAHGAGGDPHAWLDPENGKAWLDLIADDLARIDPENAEAYRANAAAGKAEIDAARAEIEASLAPLRNRPFLVFHDAFQYFERRFDLPAAGAIAFADASDPSPARLAAIRDAAASSGAACVLAEPQFKSGLVETVFAGAPVEIAIIDPAGGGLTPGPELYRDLLRGVAAKIAECL